MPVRRSFVDLLIWPGLAAGPLAWIAAHQLSYAIATTDCRPAAWTTILTVNLAAAGLALLGAALCCGGWHRTGQAEDELPERHFVAALGILLGLLFALTILAEGAAVLFFAACEQ